MKFISKHYDLVFVLFVGLFFGFTPSDTITLEISNSNLPAYQDSLLSSDFNRQWQQKLNSGAQDLGSLYTENAMKVDVDGGFLEGRAKISEYYKTKAFQIDSIVTVKSITAVSDSTTIYEIGRFMTSDKKGYEHLILWRKDNGRLLRELELIAPIEQTENHKPQIDKRRTEWMALCNAHNAENLVKNHYAEKALYYNHRPMIVGQKAIVEEYGYMNDLQYQLVLNPSIVEVVNASVVFEIGECSGSYHGNYVLVWQKGKDGEWRIFFDSNI